MITFNHDAKENNPLPICFVTASGSHHQEHILWEQGNGAFHQILFVVNGTGTVRCQGHSYALKKGSAFFIAKGVPVEYGGTEDLITAFLTANGPAVDALMRYYHCNGFLLRESVDLDKYLSIIDSVILSCHENNRPGYLSALTYSLYTLFFDPPKTQMSHLERVVMYMENHFTEKLSLEQLAEIGCMSVSKLSHDFKAEYQKSVFSHIIDMRLNYAHTLLISSPNMATKVAAASCGFDDVSYFCRAYRSKFGKSPSQEKAALA